MHQHREAIPRRHGSAWYLPLTMITCLPRHFAAHLRSYPQRRFAGHLAEQDGDKHRDDVGRNKQPDHCQGARRNSGELNVTICQSDPGAIPPSVWQQTVLNFWDLPVCRYNPAGMQGAGVKQSAKSRPSSQPLTKLPAYHRHPHGEKINPTVASGRVIPKSAPAGRKPLSLLGPPGAAV